METVAQALGRGPVADAPLEDLLAAVLCPGGDAKEQRAAAYRLMAELGEPGRWHRLVQAELADALARADALTRGAVVAEGPIAAARLGAALELGRRAARQPWKAGTLVHGAADVEPLLRGLLDGLMKEVFVVVLLDAKHRVMRAERVSEGCLTWSVVHPREVFAPAVRESAGAIIVAHNHPSGDPTPSLQDLEVTTRLVRAGKTLGIPLLDHVVLGRERYVSMRARGMLTEEDP